MPAMTLVQATNSGYQSGNSGTSWTHSCTGNNMVLVVCVSVFDSHDNIGDVTVTFNGGGSSQGSYYVVSDSGSGPVYHYVITFIDPDFGSHSISVSLPASCDWVGHGMSFQDTDFANGIFGDGGNIVQSGGGSGGTASKNIDVIDSSCLVLGFFTTKDTDGITRGSGMLNRGEVTGSLGTSNITTAGPYSGTSGSPNTITTEWSGNGTGKKWVISTIYLVSDSTVYSFKPCFAKNANKIIQVLPS